jgi:hypothetical protein
VLSIIFIKQTIEKSIPRRRKRELTNGHAKGHPFRYFVLLQMKMETKAAHGCVENITGLKFGDLYKRTQKKDIFKILNLAPYFMILKTITNSDRRKAELITDKEQCYLLHTRYSRHLKKTIPQVLHLVFQ